MSSSFIPSGSPTTGNSASQILSNRNRESSNLLYGSQSASLNQASTDLTSRVSNLGSTNSLKGPTARTLFYNGGFYSGEDAKYGQFLFYSFGSQSNDFIQEYYKSENAEYNSSVSSVNPITGASKNPSAGALVKETAAAIEKTGANPKQQLPGSNSDAQSVGGFIIGGLSAPYFWKDFLYCKYYGAIPNNYMITLRRFPAPMRDNLSLPDQLVQTALYKQQGAGRPVAQAVTWWGGGTGNTLNDVVGFTTGLKWIPKTQSELKEQEGFDQGFFKSVLGRAFAGTASQAGAADILSKLGDGANIALSATQGANDEVTIPKINYALRDKMTQPGGPLSDFIFNSVDTVDTVQVRDRGLYFNENDEISLNFHYELTSVGEVNTKAAMFDIIGNLLAIGTNYGQFLTPEIRYNNKFPVIGFPGGDQGLLSFYSDPIAWTKTAIKYLADPDGTTMNNPDAQRFKESADQVDKNVAQLQSVIKQMASTDLGALAAEIDRDSAIGNIIAFALADDFITEIKVPLGLQTGAPTGEWHLVVGNPMNPIAMIGNLVCTGVSIEFGEALGPDDFPTEITATFTLKHGRDRERGEIESMFNRGDGRLYQSSVPTYATGQSIYNQGTTTGDIITTNPNDSTQVSPRENLNFNINQQQ